MRRLGLGPSPLRVLCLGAHPDDIEIGCGGALLLLCRRPDVSVSGLVMTGDPERAREACASLPRFAPGARVHVLGLPDGRLPAHWNAVKDALEETASRRRADVVFAPRADDAHQDHRLVGDLARTVWRDQLILHYEIPKWDGDLATPSHYVALDEELAARKVTLLNECFPTQRDREWWDDELFLGLMRLRGIESRTRYAEGFHASKVMLDLAGRTEGP